VRFRTTSRLDREYLRNATKNLQSENSVANYGHSRTSKLNFVYFSPQTAKNRTGVPTHPPAIVQSTGVNNSVAFAKWQQRAAIKLGITTHSSFTHFCHACKSDYSWGPSEARGPRFIEPPEPLVSTPLLCMFALLLFFLCLI